MKASGTLYLIPNIIAEGTQHEVIPASVKNALSHIQYFLAEDIRTARRYLSSLKIYDSIEALHFEVLNKSTKESELEELFKPLAHGNNMGVISESGCPGVADPGALAVAYAHRNNIKVVPLVGPSSLLMALMASGLNGQCFAFQGYLPVNGGDAQHVIREYEKESRLKGQTQIFIETPYRNNALFANLLKTLHNETRLCIASDVTGTMEFIHTRRVKDWKSQVPQLPKTPTVFLFLAS
jgi:16S rRNA (cytidine1402-2'-O)-methyltransferase